jgi:C-terminal processing protease CtpA/Prc
VHREIEKQEISEIRDSDMVQKQTLSSARVVADKEWASIVESRAQSGDEELCGVGILLSQNEEGELIVLALNEGGPAARSNMVRKDDVLCTIDETDVYR